MAEVPPVDEADLTFRCRLDILYDARTQHWLRARYTVVTEVDEVRTDPTPKPIVRITFRCTGADSVARRGGCLRHCTAPPLHYVRPVIVFVIRSYCLDEEPIQARQDTELKASIPTLGNGRCSCRYCGRDSVVAPGRCARTDCKRSTA